VTNKKAIRDKVGGSPSNAEPRLGSGTMMIRLRQREALPKLGGRGCHRMERKGKRGEKKKEKRERGRGKVETRCS